MYVCMSTVSLRYFVITIVLIEGLLVKQDNCYCGSCDRGFSSEEDFETHCAGHVTCGLDGCTLSADPKVIDKHIKLQHKSGLYKRLVNENPHDIQKWIEERKR
ncbi:hypothetical protein LSTR_LSTR015970 [Laodelphax striatellus]|uniref:C2H2-type domain-containing protein n=1 Tax=Laodelphax striatellus TaxID=195883 RepID=A0A482WHW2_LAOST|nr:hypothetical protein LSTR_LSTR015970 [Laodelphax striatellus]